MIKRFYLKNLPRIDINVANFQLKSKGYLNFLNKSRIDPSSWFSASTNCKTFALFGPTNEIVYGPWGDHKIIKSRDYPGIDDPLNLSVEKVLNAIKKEIEWLILYLKMEQ